MKYIKLFENFNLNEELRSASYYNFSKFLEREYLPNGKTRFRCK